MIDSDRVSLIIPFWDKDASLIEKKIQNIKTINFAGEVIFVDDRKDKSSKISMPEKYKLISYEGNKGTFNARREGVLAASKEYIQFADIDDEILEIEDYGLEDYDCHLFKARINNYSIFDAPPLKSHNFGAKAKEELRFLFRRGLWSVILKKDILMKFYDFCAIDENFSVLEDFFMLYILVDFISSIKIHKQAIYDYSLHNRDYPPEIIDFCKTNLIKLGYDPDKFITFLRNNLLWKK